jgi:hypothetical protein
MREAVVAYLMYNGMIEENKNGTQDATSSDRDSNTEPLEYY